MKVVQEKDAPLFKRKEFVFAVEHKGKPTPKMGELVKMIVDARKVDEKVVKVDYVEGGYGELVSYVHAKVYENEKDKEYFEKINKKQKVVKKEGQQ